MLKIYIGLYVFLTALALVLLKLSSANGAFAEIIHGKLVFNVSMVTVGAVLSYGISFLLYMFLISKFDLGYIIPLTTALVYILIFIASFIIFKENFTILKVVAIVLIVSGVALLNLGGQK